MGQRISKENWLHWAMAAAGIAVLGGLIVLFVLALVPRAEEKPADYLSYSFEGLDRVPEDQILYREDPAVPVPAGRDELTGLCLLPGGGFAVSGGTTVFIFSPAHALARRIETERAVFALGAAREPAGTVLYCGGADRITLYAIDGRRLDHWASLGELARLTSLSVTRRFVYAADAGNKSIAVFDHLGAMKRLVTLRTGDGSGFLVPGLCFDVAADQDDRLWAVDPGRHRVVELSAGGDILSSWGKAAPTLEGFSGCCNPAHIALLPGGRFAAQEKGLLRIKLYDGRGRLLGFVAGPRSFHPSQTLLDVAAAPDGRVYVADPYRKAVRIFSPRGGA